MTVKELRDKLDEEIAAGHGDSEVIIHLDVDEYESFSGEVCDLGYFKVWDSIQLNCT